MMHRGREVRWYNSLLVSLYKSRRMSGGRDDTSDTSDTSDINEIYAFRLAIRE